MNKHEDCRLNGTDIGVIKKSGLTHESSAAEILRTWNYREEGLLVLDAREKIREWTKKTYSRVYPTEPNNGRITRMSETLKNNRRYHFRGISDIKNQPLTKIDGPTPTWDSPTQMWECSGRRFITVREESTKWSDNSYYPISSEVSYKTVMLHPDWDTCQCSVDENPTYGKIWNQDYMVSGRVSHDCRGSWRLKILIELGIVKSEWVRGKRHIQLRPEYSIEEVGSSGDFTIYRRLLGTDVVDFCAAAGKLSYHAGTRQGSIKGLQDKIRVEKNLAPRKISYTYCVRHLGFCRIGLRQFCSDTGLDISLDYTLEEIGIAVDRAGCRETYNRELEILGT